MNRDGPRRKRARLWAALYVRLFGADVSGDSEDTDDEWGADGGGRWED